MWIPIHYAINCLQLKEIGKCIIAYFYDVNYQKWPNEFDEKKTLFLFIKKITTNRCSFPDIFQQLYVRYYNFAMSNENNVDIMNVTYQNDVATNSNV